jgi:hypothetical protein
MTMRELSDEIATFGHGRFLLLPQKSPALAPPLAASRVSRSSLG